MRPLRALRRRWPDPGPDIDTALTREWLPRLRESGWVLPPSLARDDVVPAWTRLGVVDGAGAATVDGRGLVTLDGRVSIDWAIGAEDRWYHPAREANVTQVRVDHAPVVETTVRVPGGTVVHRAFGVRATRHPGGDEWVAVEVENRSAVPVVVAWVVRPFTPTQLVHQPSVRLARALGVAPGAPGPRVVEVFDPWAVLPRAPSRWARTLDGTDPLAVVEAGAAESGPMPEDDTLFAEEPGLASAALLTPVPHTATARIALLPHGAGPGAVDDDDLDAGATRVPWPGDLPAADAVVRGWSALAERGPRLEVPDPVLGDAVAAARRSLLLSHRVRPGDDGPEHVLTAGRPERDDEPAERLEILAALAWWGDTQASDRLLATWPEGQQRGGGFGSPEATAAALRALAVHVTATGDPGPAAAWLPEVGGAVEALGRSLRRPPEGTDLRAVAEGLDAGALLLHRLDQPEAAGRVAADAARALGAAGPAPTGPDLDAPGTTPRALAAAAVAATRAGAPAGALWALLRRATATWTWSDPEAWAGDDGLVTARLLDATARLLVADGADGLAVLPWLPPAWWGLGWELHGAPTRWGRLSVAVRWHGDRPAVLWEVAGPGEGVVLRIPGLDPRWSTGEPRGEALLAAVPRTDEVVEVEASAAVAAPPRSVWRPTDPGPDAPEGSSFT